VQKREEERREKTEKEKIEKLNTIIKIASPAGA
jgi:hypothetical protein